MQRIVSILLLLICLFTHFKGNTQTSLPFPTENVVWTEIQHNIPNDSVIVHYGIIGDTLIKGYTYKKIFTSRDSIFRETNEDLLYYGALRVEGSKALLLPKPRYAFDTTEYLIYDADLEVGDTLYYGIVHSEAGGSLIVHSIDSIQLIDDTLRKRWNFKRTYYRSDGTSTREDCIFSWIEGIGNTKCPFNEPFYCTFFSSDATRLLFFEQNNQKLYIDSQESNCSLTVSTDEQIFQSELNIFPNPTNGILSLQSSSGSDQIIEIRIIDLSGKLLVEEAIDFNGIHQLNIEYLPVGIYFIILKDQNGFLIQGQKLIKL